MHEHQCDAYCMLCLCFSVDCTPVFVRTETILFLQEGVYYDKLINGMMGIVLATIIHSNVNMHIEIIACPMTPSFLHTSYNNNTS